MYGFRSRCMNSWQLLIFNCRTTQFGPSNPKFCKMGCQALALIQARKPSCKTLVLLLICGTLHLVQCQDIIFENDWRSSLPQPGRPSRHHHYHSQFPSHSHHSHRGPPQFSFYSGHPSQSHSSHPFPYPPNNYRDDSFSENRRPGIQLPILGNLNLQEVVRNPIGTLQSLFGSLGGNRNEKPEPTEAEPPPVPTPPPRPAEQHHNHGPENSCKTMHGTPGVCVPLRDCDSLQRLLRGRPRYKVNQILGRSSCGGGGGNSFRYAQRNDVCCGDSGEQAETENPFANIVATKPPTQRPTAPPPPPPPKPTTPPVIDNLSVGECGQKNEAHTRIVGGRESAIGGWPWIAALGYRDANSGKINYLCGGALLTKSHVVTAAHCTHNRKDLVSVRLGDHDLFSDSDGLKPLEMPVGSVIQNPDYDSTTFKNDIAIIKLKRPIAQYSETVHPICLPSTPDLRTSSFEGFKPFVAGWGSTQFNGPSSSKLMEVQLPVVPLDQCQDKYKLFKNIRVDENNICAGHERGGKDSCQGDSGGPLMQQVANKRYAIIGVVSFGYKCAEPGYPGVYTRTTSFLDWIQDTIRNTS